MVTKGISFDVSDGGIWTSLVHIFSQTTKLLR